MERANCGWVHVCLLKSFLHNWSFHLLFPTIIPHSGNITALSKTKPVTQVSKVKCGAVKWKNREVGVQLMVRLQKKMGGVGICLWLNAFHFLPFKLGCGSCTNTRAELLALWASLRVTKNIGLPYLHIFGDSSVIINWAKKESTLDMVNLEAWCLNTTILMSSFMWVNLSHVYREHNRRADILSKEGLRLPSGYLLLTEYFGNEINGENSSQLF